MLQKFGSRIVLNSFLRLRQWARLNDRALCHLAMLNVRAISADKLSVHDSQLPKPSDPAAAEPAAPQPVDTWTSRPWKYAVCPARNRSHVRPAGCSTSRYAIG